MVPNTPGVLQTVRAASAEPNTPNPVRGFHSRLCPGACPRPTAHGRVQRKRGENDSLLWAVDQLRRSLWSAQPGDSGRARRSETLFVQELHASFYGVHL